MSTTNDFSEAIPTSARKTVYLVYGLIGAGLGSCQVGYSAAEVGQPVWLTVALSVFAYLGIALGITAFSNTPGTAVTPSAEVVDQIEDKATDPTTETSGVVTDPTVDPTSDAYAAGTTTEAPVEFEVPEHADQQVTTAPSPVGPTGSTAV